MGFLKKTLERTSLTKLFYPSRGYSNSGRLSEGEYSMPFFSTCHSPNYVCGDRMERTLEVHTAINEELGSYSLIKIIFTDLMMHLIIDM